MTIESMIFISGDLMAELNEEFCRRFEVKIPNGEVVADVYQGGRTVPKQTSFTPDTLRYLSDIADEIRTNWPL